MTTLQICALIFLSLAVAGLYSLAYRAGKVEGLDQGIALGEATSKRALLELQADAASLRSRHQSLSLSYMNLLNSQRFGEEEYQHLLALAQNSPQAQLTKGYKNTPASLEMAANLTATQCQRPASEPAQFVGGVA